MSYPHWPLPQRIAWDHSPVHAPGKSGCKCGAQVTDQAWIAHVVEVTMESVAAEIDEHEPADEDFRHRADWKDGLDLAARIARGEVAA